MKKITVLALFGGMSVEHNISLLSASSVLSSLDTDKYNVIPVAVDKLGNWYYYPGETFWQENKLRKELELRQDVPRYRVALIPDTKGAQLINIGGAKGMKELTIDLVFPVLHGLYGEDGSIQGLCKFYNIACVGSDILCSAMSNDKDITKRILAAGGLQVVPSITLYKQLQDSYNYGAMKAKLGAKIYVKPANMGSSLGISCVSVAAEFAPALEEAFRYDSKVLVEKAIDGKQLECGILELPAAETLVSRPAEILIPNNETYSFELKYKNSMDVQLLLRSTIPDFIEDLIRKQSLEVFELLGGRGMMRVDFFLASPDFHDQDLQNKEHLFINEVQTIPGMTSASLYPLLWDKLSFTELLDILIMKSLKTT